MTKSEALEFIGELRNCAWIAHKGFFCCETSRVLGDSQIPDNFLVFTQQNAYMCANIWWTNLFGCDSPTYQRNRNFQRDFRLVCNAKRSQFPDYSGRMVDQRLREATGLDEGEYLSLRRTELEKRNNFFAHVNPAFEVVAKELNCQKIMFDVTMDLVGELLDLIPSVCQDVAPECQHAKTLIQDFNAAVGTDHARMHHLLTVR